MSQDQKVQMPSSGGGLVRYFDDTKTRVELKPEYVVAMIVIVVVAGIYLYKFGL
jgi:preprotein translocase subunit Sec61beta